MKKDKQFPYARVYLNEKYLNKDYSEIYIAPVDLTHMLRLNLWEVFSEAYLFPDDVKKNHRLIAQFAHDEFVKACQKDPQHHFKVVDSPGPDTLILETSLVQLTASKAALYAASYYTWIPSVVLYVAPVVARSEDSGNGLVAIEARMRDGASGEIVGMFADRERPPVSIANVSGFFWWEPVKPIIKDWALEFVQIENGLRGKQVKEVPTIAIITFDKY